MGSKLVIYHHTTQVGPWTHYDFVINRLKFNLGELENAEIKRAKGKPRIGWKEKGLSKQAGMQRFIWDPRGFLVHESFYPYPTVTAVKSGKRMPGYEEGGKGFGAAFVVKVLEHFKNQGRGGADIKVLYQSPMDDRMVEFLTKAGIKTDGLYTVGYLLQKFGALAEKNKEKQRE